MTITKKSQIPERFMAILPFNQLSISLFWAVVNEFQGQTADAAFADCYSGRDTARAGAVDF
jgi:hypothetical protein